MVDTRLIPPKNTPINRTLKSLQPTVQNHMDPRPCRTSDSVTRVLEIVAYNAELESARSCCPLQPLVEKAPNRDWLEGSRSLHSVDLLVELSKNSRHSTRSGLATTCTLHTAHCTLS